MSLEPWRAPVSQRHWRENLWDLWPLVDGEQRPIRWTPNSLILSPHPSSPVVVARVFPSSSSFSLPSPNPVLNNPRGYSSPSVIEVSPSDEYVFAFFDGKGNDAVACIWHREETIDTWKVNIFWNIKPGQGVVLAKWLGEERMWLHTTPPTRAPPLGPSNQFGKITLLLVNQSHTVQIVHRSSPSFPFQLISASLRHTSQVNAGDRPVICESTNGPGGLSICVKAAVGLGYNESSIIVATSSTIVPPSSSTLVPLSSASTSGISSPFLVAGLPTPSPTILPQPIWETFGPERIVRLCEVKVTAHGFILGLTTTPMPPIFPLVPLSSRLTNIVMLPRLPQEGVSTPEGSAVDDSAASSKLSPGTLLHVILSFLDFENCPAPRSDLLCFEIQRNKTSSATSKGVAWCHRHITTRMITTSAVSFVLPSHIPGASLALVGLLDLEGVASSVPDAKTKRSVKGVGIGRIVMIKIPELEDDFAWEPSILMTETGEADAYPPISAVVSPGGSLICTSPAMWCGVSKLCVQAHPCRLNTLDAISIVEMTESLLSALLLDRPPTDILHSLRDPSFPLSSAIDVLVDALRALDCEEFSSRDWHSAIIGIVLEVFRSRSKKLSEENSSMEQADLDERWHVAIDICSVKAVVGAFEACKEADGGYDLGPVWQLIGLSIWLVEFMERLLHSCVLREGVLSMFRGTKSSVGSQRKGASEKDAVNVKMEALDIGGDNLFDVPEPVPSVDGASPQLVHILHPFTLQNLIKAVTHLNAFREYLGTLCASGLKASIAKDMLMDVLDCSGIDFNELAVGLVKARNELHTVDADVIRRCFCSLTPLPSTYDDVLLKICRHITSESAVSKPRLFVKPADLVDGVSRLGLATVKASREHDIVSKEVFSTSSTRRMCARCKGRTETGQTPLPRGKEVSDFGLWSVWEHEWEKCICGGLWIRDRTR